ncbi:Hol1p [Sugiyamaella lignohabitans]|uniref:Hol1p n=1 Tax=Sugiyamaella lignohabitans TaxID=796027 RepID=A0A167EZ45_9ASCO|nr:Hol1p [Sugiyamaella lignohabitans]ANB14629.1 Hol1p [Sugiyamaella lignohabitans]
MSDLEIKHPNGSPFTDQEKNIGSQHEEQYPPPSELNTEYILQRHGTLELDPMPSHDPLDPLNWPALKKHLHLALIAYSCMLVTFGAAGIVPAYPGMAEEYGVSIPTCSYFTSAQILISGIVPIFTTPIMNKYGRKKIQVISCLCCCAANIGGGFAKTYGQQMATRVLVGLFVSPSLGLGAVLVTEMFFSHQRGSKNGWWSLMITLGTPGGPFIMGFVVKYAAIKWVYFILAIMNFVAFLGWMIASETLWERDGIVVNEPDSLFKFKSKSNVTINLWSFIAPLAEAREIRVFIPSLAYAVVFCYANIVLIVETPQVFGPKFGLDAVGLGLQMIAVLVGSIIGEVMSGPLSDWWMTRCVRKRGVKVIEDRLTLSYIGFILAMVGIIVWGVRLEQATPMKWNITPLVGAAIAACGNQIVTTILITYSIDVDYKRSIEIGNFINFFRQTYGFIGPFYFPDMFDNLGFSGAGGLMAGLMGVVSLASVLALQLYFTKRAKKTLGI